MKCSACGAELAPDSARCPRCGAGVSPGSGPGDPYAETESTHIFGPGAARSGKKIPDSQPPTAASDPVLGVVVAYTDVAEPSSSRDPHHGRVYPLRQGDVLFVGRPPAPPEVFRSDGTQVRPAFCHLFPKEFAHISRRHMTVEMDPAGGVLLTDLSLNGIFLIPEQRHLQKDPEQAFQKHHLDKGTTLLVGLDAASAREPGASRFQLQIVMPGIPLARQGIKETRA